MVDEKKAKFVSSAGGKTTYLCSGMCKSEFDKNPSRYGYLNTASFIGVFRVNLEKILYRKMQACKVS